MCLILVAWRTHPRYPCIIAANRDEFHSRATEPAHWWPDRPGILAGRDLLAGGTWLGVSRTGRFAALTNFRAPEAKRATAPSRGTLVSGALASSRPVNLELANLRRTGADFNGFNLLFSDGRSLGVYESVSGEGRTLGPGLYGLSNHFLDTPWPKVQRSKARLQVALGELPDPCTLFELLRDDRPALDDELPRTGVSLEWERLLSSAFVRGRDYGTRCSTVIRIDDGGSACFDEWTWDASDLETSRCRFEFRILAQEPNGGMMSHE